MHMHESWQHKLVPQKKKGRSAGRRHTLAARGAFERRRRAVLGDVRVLGELLMLGEQDAAEVGLDLFVRERLQRQHAVSECDLPRLQRTRGDVRKETAHARRTRLQNLVQKY